LGGFSSGGKGVEIKKKGALRLRTPIKNRPKEKKHKKNWQDHEQGGTGLERARKI